MIFWEHVLDKYHEIGKKHGAEVQEIILWASKGFVMERADKRGWREGGLLTPEKVWKFWDEIDMLKAKRPNAHVLDVTGMNEEEVLAALTRIIQ